MKKNIYTKKIIKVLFLVSLLTISTYTFTNVSGPASQYTGAPGEGTCGNSGCHGSPTSSGTNWSAITMSGIPAGGYVPGTTYTVTFSGSTAATSKNGFQVTALNSSGNAAGAFTAGTGSQTQTFSSRNYVAHTASGTSMSSWSFSWTAPGTAVGTITFYAALNATNNNSINDGGDLVYVKTFSYTPGNLPTAVIAPATGTAICLGDTLYLQGSGLNNPTSYAWSFPGALPAELPPSSTVQNPKIKYTTSGFKTIRLTTSNANGSSTQAQITVNIVAKPTAAITPSGPQVICGGDSVTLSAPAGAGLTYLWSPGNETTQTIKVGSAGSYNVKVTNSTNCFATSSNVTVTTAAKPVVTLATSKDSACVTDSVQLSVSSGQYVYKYYINGVRVDSTLSNTVMKKLTAGSNLISVIVNNGSCSSNPVTKTVVSSAQDPAPALTCGNASSSSVSFNIAGSNPQISLDTGKTWISPNSGSVHTITGLTPNKAITAYARAAGGGACAYTLSSNRTCVANACQPITFTLGYKDKVCLNANTDTLVTPLVIANLNVVNYGVKYNNSGFTKSLNYNAQVALGNNTIAISIIDSANLGCSKKDTGIVITGINPIASVPVVSFGAQKACSNGAVTINTTKPSGAGLFTYYRNSDTGAFIVRTLAQGADAGSLPIQLYGFKDHDMVKVVVLDPVSGCKKTSAPAELRVYNPDPAMFAFVKQNLNIQVTDISTSVKSRTWDFGDGTVAANSTPSKTHTYTSASSYRIILSITDTNGCFNADSQMVAIVASGIAQNMLAADAMQVYPNPASTALTLTWNKELGSTATMLLLDLQGKEIVNTKVNRDEIMDVAQLAKGAYILKLYAGDKMGWQKLVIE